VTSRLRAESWAALVLTLFGIAGIVGARTLPFGNVTRPGAGFFPMCLAVALTFVAAAVFVRSLGARDDADRPAPHDRPAPAARARVVRAAAALAALLVYAFALEDVGFGVTTFLLIVFLFRAIEPQRWAVAVGGAIVTVIACHVLFRVWLGVRLPLGPWGF